MPRCRHLVCDPRHVPHPHSRVAAGQEAQHSRVQAPHRHAQAIKPVFQAHHQGPPGWGQGCRVPWEQEGQRREASGSRPARRAFPPSLLTSHHGARPEAALAPQVQEHGSVPVAPVMAVYPVPLRGGTRGEKWGRECPGLGPPVSPPVGLSFYLVVTERLLCVGVRFCPVRVIA